MRATTQSGYSLVELLVVLALLGLIAVAISGGMSFGARVWERTEREVTDTELARGGHAFLRNLLSHIYPRSEAGQGTFTGEAGRVEFLSDPASSGELAGVLRFKLTARRDGDRISLVLAQSAERGSAAAREDVLLSGAKAIAFAYAEASGGALAWSDSWQGRSGVPAAVRIRITFPPGEGRWPDLIVRPRIDRAANCIYDPVSFDCRGG